MEQVKEDYCSFELSKLLTNKGFDVQCEQAYNYKGDFFEFFRDCPDIVFCFRPTVSLACKWLREVHNLHVDSSIYIDTDGDSEHEYNYTYWDWLIFNSESGRIIAEPQIGCGRYDSYEQACEVAIKYCLEHLI